MLKVDTFGNSGVAVAVIIFLDRGKFSVSLYARATYSHSPSYEKTMADPKDVTGLHFSAHVLALPSHISQFRAQVQHFYAFYISFTSL